MEDGNSLKESLSLTKLRQELSMEKLQKSAWSVLHMHRVKLYKDMKRTPVAGKGTITGKQKAKQLPEVTKGRESLEFPTKWRVRIPLQVSRTFI